MIRDEQARVCAWEAAGVVLVMSTAAALRLYRLDLGWFGVDQARDIATALDIAAGDDFPIIGPTMRRVTRLGVLYYYFWSVPYLLWRDPIAGYWFAAFLALAALALTWWTARRLWGRCAALIALVVGAAHPVWVIDSRICWAPAALPAASALLLWLVVKPEMRTPGLWSASRAAALGAVLGVALQLHLTMVGFVVVAAALALIERPPARVLGAGMAGFVATALPALWALALPVPGETGVTGLAARAMPVPSDRLAALALLPARIPSAFAHWPGDDRAGTQVLLAAGLCLSVLTWAGIIRLVGRAIRGERSACLLVTVVAVVGTMVVMTPGEAWYYYLDSLLPLWALAVGALLAPRIAPSVGRDHLRPVGVMAPTGGGAFRSRVSLVAGGAAVAASFTASLCVATWLHLVARSGYTPVDPILLSLDRRPGPDAVIAGRLVTLGVKRAVAAVMTAEADTPDASRPRVEFDTLWRRLHGPAFADATGDNAFWARWSAVRVRPPAGSAERSLAATEPEDVEAPGSVTAASISADPERHVGLWYLDHPTAVVLAASSADDVESLVVGPLLVVRYRPAIDYQSCRGDGVPLPVPVRVVPHPKRYGDGTVAMPRSLPVLIECTLAPGTGRTRVVAALGGSGALTLRGPDGERSAPGRESALCMARSALPTSVRVEIEAESGGASDLDLYDLPKGVGCPP